MQLRPRGLVCARLLIKPPNSEAMHATDHEAMQACRPAGSQAQKHYTAAQDMSVPEGSSLKAGFPI